MSFRAIAAIPVLLVAISIAVTWGAPDASRTMVDLVQNELVKVVALVGLTVATFVFERGDYLRRGWGLNALCYALLLVHDASLLLAPGAPTAAVQALRTILIVLANLVAVLGTVTLARAWHVAGLAPPGSTIARGLVIAVAIGAACVFAGPSLLLDLKATFGGDPGSAWKAASDLGDLVSLPLVAPVALTALAVRGGMLRWPWVLFTASLLGWLLYDAFATLPDLVHVEAETCLKFAEHFRVLAGAAACAAGLAQWRAAREIDASV
jgi:hypothetical protein